MLGVRYELLVRYPAGDDRSPYERAWRLIHREDVEIQAIFRLVKLTADFDYVAYILAFDEKMVAVAIGERYASRTR